MYLINCVQSTFFESGGNRTVNLYAGALMQVGEYISLTSMSFVCLTFHCSQSNKESHHVNLLAPHCDEILHILHHLPQVSLLPCIVQVLLCHPTYRAEYTIHL